MDTHQDLQDLGLKGWRDRVSGTMHLRGDCPDFERLEAWRIEDTLWSPHVEYPRLCSWCFPLLVREQKPWDFLGP